MSPTNPTVPSVSDLATAIRAAIGDLSNDDAAIAAAIYAILAPGRPASSEAIAARADVPEASVRAFLDTAPGVYRDDEGDVVGFWGLAIPPMPHRFQVEGGAPIHAWCALDPFLIVPAVGRAARVTSADPVTGETITMTVTPEGPADAPAEAVVSMLVPDGPFDHDVIRTFCHAVLTFASRASGDAWVAEHPGTALYTLEEVAEIGRRAWAPIIDAAARR